MAIGAFSDIKNEGLFKATNLVGRIQSKINNFRERSNNNNNNNAQV